MLFKLIRFVVLVILIVGSVLIIRKSAIHRKKLAQGIAVSICVIAIALTSMVPVENAFVRFETPEEVFEYANTGEIQDVLFWEKTAMIIYKDNNGTVSHYLVPQVEGAWSIPGNDSLIRVHHKLDHNGTVDIYNANNTDDYYGFASVGRIPEDEVVIIDELGNVLSENIVNVSGTGFLYFSISDVSHEYYLLFNGERIPLF